MICPELWQLLSGILNIPSYGLGELISFRILFCVFQTRPFADLNANSMHHLAITYSGYKHTYIDVAPPTTNTFRSSWLTAIHTYMVCMVCSMVWLTVSLPLPLLTGSVEWMSTHHQLRLNIFTSDICMYVCVWVWVTTFVICTNPFQSPSQHHPHSTPPPPPALVCIRPNFNSLHRVYCRRRGYAGHGVTGSGCNRISGLLCPDLASGGDYLMAYI